MDVETTWDPLVAQLVKNLPAMQETTCRFLGWDDPWREDRLPTPIFLALMVKNPPAVRETWVRFLNWEDSLEEGMATHSSVLAWRIPWMEEPGGLRSMGSQRVGHDGVTKHSIGTI